MGIHSKRTVSLVGTWGYSQKCTVAWLVHGNTHETYLSRLVHGDTRKSNQKKFDHSKRKFKRVKIDIASTFFVKIHRKSYPELIALLWKLETGNN